MVESTEGPSKRIIADRYEVGDRRWGDDTAGLHEAVDLLVGRSVLVEVIAAGTPESVAINVPGATPAKRTGVWDGSAVAVHDWAPIAPVLATDDDAAKAQIAQLVDLLEGLAAAGTVHGGIVPESVVLHDGARLTTAGAALAAAGFAANSPFASPARRRGAPPRPADDAWAVAAVLAMSLSGVVPTIAAATALTSAASAARPELMPAFRPLIALAQTPVFAPIRRVSGWRRRRTVAAGIVLALTGGGTAAALIASSSHESRKPPAEQSEAAAAGPTTTVATVGSLPPAVVPADVVIPEAPTSPSTPGVVRQPKRTTTTTAVLGGVLTPIVPALPPVVLPPVLEPPVTLPPLPKPPKVDTSDHDDEGLHFGLGHEHHDGDSDGVHVPQGNANGREDDEQKGNRKTREQ